MAPTREQYRVVIAVPLIPVGIALICSFFIPESPRWLASKDRNEAALASLAKLRNRAADDPGLEKEFSDMNEQIRSKNDILADTSILSIVKEIATVPSYRSRFLLGAVMQTVAQWSGGNGITYYIPEIFQYAGVSGDNQSLITSGAYGAVKLVFTMVFTWGLVDVFGRRPSFIAGLFLQCITHIYMAVYMGIWIDSENKAASDAAIASVFIYAMGWSIGLCTVQYLYGTEIYPTRIRSVCYATNMVIGSSSLLSCVSRPTCSRASIYGALTSSGHACARSVSSCWPFGRPKRRACRWKGWTSCLRLRGIRPGGLESARSALQPRPLITPRSTRHILERRASARARLEPAMAYDTARHS